MGTGQTGKRGLRYLQYMRFLLILAVIGLTACTPMRSDHKAAVYSTLQVQTAVMSLTPPGFEATAGPLEPTTTPGPGAYWMPGQFADIGYQIPLTIQQLEPEKAVLFFELEQPSPGYLLYWHESTTISDAEVLRLAPDQIEHIIVLQGLIPNSAYSIEVGLECGEGCLRPPSWREEEWGGITFRTPADEIRHLRVGVIGDSGFGEDVTYELVDLMSAGRLDFVIHTGDVVYRMDEQPGDPFLAYWLKYFLPFRPVLQSMPVYPVPGNHEYDYAALWIEHPFYYHVFPAAPDIREGLNAVDQNRRWYAVEEGRVQFLFLDSETVFGAPGRYEMQAWLEERLADDRFQFSIPVTHIPPFSSGRHSETGLPFRQLWHDLFRDAGVPLVISGHDHNYQRIEIEGITYLVSGGGSSVLYGMQERIPGLKSFHRVSHYVVLDLSDDAIELEVYNSLGEMIDQAGIELP